MPALGAEQITALLALHEAAALARLGDVVEGVSLCRLDAGTSSSAKHWEGRAAALAQVRRDLRAAARSGARGPWRDVVIRRLDEWREQESELGPSAAPAWLAYTVGGIAALSELLVAAPVEAEVGR